MNFTKISVTIQSALMQELSLHPGIMTIIQTLSVHGGRVLLVGGGVRDLLLGNQCKDLDIEIHGLSAEAVQETLARFGMLFVVGKSFGVFRIDGFDVDWSLPRSDSFGRKPTVVVDPHMSLKQAFRRRDLTINAMGIDLVTYELIDPFNGFEDLKRKLLRCTDPTLFVEDPLRFYRVMQFIGRFGMHPDDELNRICATMDITSISVERIEVEFQKLLLRSAQPSSGIAWLAAIGRIEAVLPELAATRGVEQDPRWHPEGDVFTHSLQALDAAVVYSYDDLQRTLALRYAALCHDLGKVSTTVRGLDGSITSYGHETAGVPLAKRLLARIMRNKELIDLVALLVRHHMAPGQFVSNGAKPRAYKRLAHALYPQATLALLADLACADACGRNAAGAAPLKSCPAIEQFRVQAAKAQVIHAPEEPILKGRDLLDRVSPGPELGKLLDRAYQLQVELGIVDKQELLKRILG
ncbi:CCA tRNA nucleotidyltransferase [Candidatus Dependentiae bacterium]|nr:CCA tRNA nucleotidyltransferase [Candidatus Dependentiae bacterium]